MKKILSDLFIIMAFYIMKDVPVNVQAATKAKVVFEFTDGTKKSWETGRPKVSAKCQGVSQKKEAVSGFRKDLYS